MQLTVPVKDACDMIGIKKTKLYELIAANKIESTTIGRRRLIKVDSLRELVA